MAHKTGIKVMLPEWLEEVRRVWTSAEEVDFPYVRVLLFLYHFHLLTLSLEQLEETYSMPLFHGFSFSLTGFARGMLLLLHPLPTLLTLLPSPHNQVHTKIT